MLTGLFSTLIIRLIHLAINLEIATIEEFIIKFTPYLVGYLFFSLMASYGISVLTRRIIHSQRVNLSQQIVQADFKVLENVKARLLPIVTDDITTIAVVIQRLPSSANGLATVLGLLIYLLWLSPFLAGLTLLAFLAIFIVIKLSLILITKFTMQSRSYTNKVYESFEGLVYGLKSLKMNSVFRRSYIDESIIPNSQKQTKYYLYDNISNAFTSRITDVILFAFLGILIVFIYRTEFISMDFFNTYLTLILFMLAPLSTISGFLSNLKKVDAAINHINELGIEISKFDEAENSESTKIGLQKAIITLSDLSFEHSNGDKFFKLGPINLTIHSNEIVFVTGGNGSGKTTLIKLLAGLYKPNSGQIAYDEFEISESLIQAYRNKISAVFTDSYVFNHLSYLNLEDKTDLSEKYLEILQLKEISEIKEGKFITTHLSEGQKRRLVLYRHLMEDKDIYIFDEWAAYQDQNSKNIFFNTLLPFLRGQGKCVINISHDSGYEQIADRIIHLKDGKLDDIRVN